MSSSKRHKYTAIDLFSGCGGLSVGLSNAGFKVLAAVESEPLACATYKLNHPSVQLIERDITTIRPSFLRKRLGLEIGELTLLAGCPPCQGFSTLRTLNGGRTINEPMNDLLFEFLKFVKVFLPQAIMMENVPGLASDTRLERFKKTIAKLGYESEARVLDAADFGTPQRRKRMVLIALRGKAPAFALKTKRRKTVKAAIASLPVPHKSDDPLHSYAVNRSAHVLALIRRIPHDGGGRTDLPEDEQLDCHKRCDGFRDIYGRMSWRGPAPTITGGCINPSKGRFLHPTQDRAITLREAALLQGFPRDYRFDLSRGKYPCAQLIGNAFPPKFAELHARTIRDVIVS